MAKVFVCRHGNTFDKGDVVTRVGARTDLPLSVSGREQANSLGEHFAEMHFDAVYCSPLLRTRQTAEAILSYQSKPPALTFAPFLKEIDYGPDENQPESFVIERIGQSAMDAWEASAIPPDGWLVDPDEIIQDWREFFGEVAGSGDTNILVMTSNGTARFIFDIVDEVPENAPRKLKTAAYGVVNTSDNGSLIIESWNNRF